MTDAATYRIETVDSLAGIDAPSWNLMVPDNHPFLRHEFLEGLERYGCVTEAVGWLPRHFLLYEDKQLLAAIPAYIKTNSFGEFVFDQSWAAAYERVGLNYYPKLVLAVPFTPATGKRLLCRPGANAQPLSKLLLKACVEFAEVNGLSSIHVLFPAEEDRLLLQEAGFLLRMDYQYHWRNHGYRDFEHYLSFFRSHKRKNVRQERRRVQDQGIRFRRLYAHELDEQQLDAVYRFYQSTFAKKGNYPALTADFFRHLARTLGKSIVVMLAEQHGRPIAASVDFRSADTLYGRYWGCDRELDALHFEACFYQGIEYCIEQQLKVFEPGAQGEHKITRGFLPVPTWSAHWLRDERFRSAIAGYLEHEITALQQYRRELDQLSPFRDTAIITSSSDKAGETPD
jgi:predicted N-acyltransferase